MGRPWYSVTGKNLSFSVVLFPEGISLEPGAILDTAVSGDCVQGR